MSNRIDTPATEPLWTAAQVQQFLAIAPATYFRWIRDGRLPKPLKIGRMVRHVPSQLLAHIKLAK